MRDTRFRCWWRVKTTTTVGEWKSSFSTSPNHTISPYGKEMTTTTGLQIITSQLISAQYSRGGYLNIRIVESSLAVLRPTDHLVEAVLWAWISWWTFNGGLVGLSGCTSFILSVVEVTIPQPSPQWLIVMSRFLFLAIITIRVNLHFLH